MPRNPDIARASLRHAAIELFAENGFEATTAAQIAARAGVTERTFFRHFPDKREVLFDGQAILGDGLTEAIGRAEAGLPPLGVLRFAFDAVVPMLEANRPFSEPRMKIIAATPALQEREVAKHVALVRLVADALVTRGVEARQASLAAEIGMAVFGHALSGWFAAPGSKLADHIESGFAAMQGLAR
jgi:AcrR family transcriptional regulator